MAQTSVPQEHQELKSELTRIAEGLMEALENVREISRGTHPAVLSLGGLGPAVTTLARRSPVPVRPQVNVDDRLPECVEMSAYCTLGMTGAGWANGDRACLSGILVDPLIYQDSARRRNYIIVLE